MVGGAVAGVALQVTDSLVPRLESSCTNIWLLAVIAVVLTTTVVPAAATTTEPAAAEEQTAGDAEDEQLVVVEKVGNVAAPVGPTEPKIAPAGLFQSCRSAVCPE